MTWVGYALLILHRILYVYFGLMVITILLSWTPLYDHAIGRFLRKITDPYLDLFRGKIIAGGFDLGPLIGLILFQFLLAALLWAF
jgi:YggT family protein